MAVWRILLLRRIAGLSEKFDACSLMKAKCVCSEPGTITRANLSIMLTLSVRKAVLVSYSVNFRDLIGEIYRLIHVSCLLVGFRGKLNAGEASIRNGVRKDE